MSSPFPGMNPFLEHPKMWAEVHHWLISIIAEKLIPKIRPQYRVKIEQRIYKINPNNESQSLLIGIPDVTIKSDKISNFKTSEKSSSSVAILEPKTQVKPINITLPFLEEIKQSYLEIVDLEKGKVVTAIEILSPVNKRKGEGRKKYLKKRENILNSLTNFVEIDLLREGEKMPILDLNIDFDYHVLISPNYLRPQANLYGINLPQMLPTIPIPLAEENENVELNLQEILNLVYERAGYDYSLDYSREIVPPLEGKYLNWCQEIIEKVKS